MWHIRGAVCQARTAVPSRSHSNMCGAAPAAAAWAGTRKRENRKRTVAKARLLTPHGNSPINGERASFVGSRGTVVEPGPSRDSATVRFQFSCFRVRSAGAAVCPKAEQEPVSIVMA